MAKLQHSGMILQFSTKQFQKLGRVVILFLLKYSNEIPKARTYLLEVGNVQDMQVNVSIARFGHHSSSRLFSPRLVSANHVHIRVSRGQRFDNAVADA